MKAHSEYVRAYRIRNPEKVRAHIAVNQRVRNGTIVPKSCERCGHNITQAHHEDYTKPLEVVWLCSKCHAARHAEIRASKSQLTNHCQRGHEYTEANTQIVSFFDKNRQAMREWRRCRQCEKRRRANQKAAKNANKKPV